MSYFESWLPLSPAQRGVFFAHQLDPSNPCYTTAELVKIEGCLDKDCLNNALRSAYLEFEQLRTRFRLTQKGPEQTVMAEPVTSLAVLHAENEDEARAWLQDDLARPMDLTAGDVVRTALICFSDRRAWWYHAAHHVVMDGYAAQQFIRRVAQLYAGAEPVSPVSLGDVIGEDPTESGVSEFWSERLKEYSGPASLAGRVEQPATKANRSVAMIVDELQNAIVSAARRSVTSWQELVIAAVGAYIGKVGGLENVRVGLPLMNRTIPGRGVRVSARTVCTQVNVLPITTRSTGTVKELLTLVRAEQEELRQDPFTRQEDLVRSLHRREPDAQLFGAEINIIPFDLHLDWINPDGSSISSEIRNLTAGPVDDLTITIRGALGRCRPVSLELDGNPLLYDQKSLDQHAARLIYFLARFADASTNADVGKISILSTEERQLVIDGFNATEVRRAPETLADRFLAQASKTPDAVALIYEGETRTYAELRDSAMAVAETLVAHGVGPRDVVAVKLQRSFKLFEAIYGIELLGSVYLPLDPDLPDSRISAMLDDADAVFVIDSAFEVASKCDGDGSWLSVGSISVDDPAYLIFTSGSTGRPKGVQISHRALDNRLAWMQNHLQLHSCERVLHKTAISFDVSIWELFWPLQVGAGIVIAPPGSHKNPRAMAATIVEQDVSIVHFVPSMLRAFLADRRSCELVSGGRVRTVVTSGEALTPDLSKVTYKWFGVFPTNLYGPTEAAIDVTFWDCAPDDNEIPIGRPVWNTSCYVLDDRLAPVPVGVTGELWLGGVQFADGYVGREDLTAQRFISNPFQSSGRIYRTGDLVSWRSDGALRYLGRKDDQVKIRGQRVELGEIEAVLSAVAVAAAVVVGMVNGQLVAWYVRDGDGDVLSILQREAVAKLPPSFVPQHWIMVDKIPLTGSGKADRKVLAEIAPPRFERASRGSVPLDLLEQRICSAFGEVLGIDLVSPDDDFFALGGDSLRVLQLLSVVETDTGHELELNTIFAHPTPHALASVLTEGRQNDGTEEIFPLRPASSDGAPLIMLPPAGGLGWCYTGITRCLPAELGIYTIQAPGISRGEPELAENLTELAGRQLKTIRALVGEKPFHVCGWSLGGMAAHAVAALARSEGQEVGAVVLLDAFPFEQWDALSSPTEAEALLGLLRMGGISEPEDKVLSRSRVRELLRNAGSALSALPERVLDGCIASVIGANRVILTPPPKVLPGDMTVVVAGAPRDHDWLNVYGWNRHIEGKLDVITIDATHDQLVRRPVADAVASVIAARIAMSKQTGR